MAKVVPERVLRASKSLGMVVLISLSSNRAPTFFLNREGEDVSVVTIKTLSAAVSSSSSGRNSAASLVPWPRSFSQLSPVASVRETRDRRRMGVMVSRPESL